MKDLFLAVVASVSTMRGVCLALVLAGCAETSGTAPPNWYRPKQGNSFGYSEMQLNDRVYQVTFDGRVSSEARQGVIRRAAEIAASRGMAAFIVLSSDDSSDVVVKKRFVVGRVRRERPVSLATVQLITTAEYRGLPPGTFAYVASTLLGIPAPPEPTTPPIPAPPAGAPVASPSQLQPPDSGPALVPAQPVPVTPATPP